MPGLVRAGLGRPCRPPWRPRERSGAGGGNACLPVASLGRTTHRPHPRGPAEPGGPQPGATVNSTRNACRPRRPVPAPAPRPPSNTCPQVANEASDVAHRIDRVTLEPCVRGLGNHPYRVFAPRLRSTPLGQVRLAVTVHREGKPLSRPRRFLPRTFDLDPLVAGGEALGEVPIVRCRLRGHRSEERR